MRKKLEEISEKLDLMKDMKVLVLGDTIVDRYTYVIPRGRAIKDPILSTQFYKREDYAGGVLAVANHISSYVDEVQVVTLMGDRNPRLEFIEGSTAENVVLQTFTKENSPTTIKERFIDFYRGHKLFKIEYMEDTPISEKLSDKITKFLSRELPKYDLVVVSDYGHGFINENIRDVLQEKSNFLALNVQSNSSNMGYNYINHYESPDFITMDEEELRLPLMMRFEEIGEVISKFYEKFKYEKFLVTLGKNGCMYFDHGKKYSGDSLVNEIVDTVGAGDSVFAITSLFSYLDIDGGTIPFIANCAGGIGANIVGNKESVSKDKLLNFIGEIYDGMG